MLALCTSHSHAWSIKKHLARERALSPRLNLSDERPSWWDRRSTFQGAGCLAGLREEGTLTAEFLAAPTHVVSVPGALMRIRGNGRAETLTVAPRVAAVGWSQRPIIHPAPYIHLSMPMVPAPRPSLPTGVVHTPLIVLLRGHLRVA